MGGKMEVEKEFNLSKELEKWCNKWIRKIVTGRAIVELDLMNKEFIKRLVAWNNDITDTRNLFQFLHEEAGPKLITK